MDLPVLLRMSGLRRSFSVVGTAEGGCVQGADVQDFDGVTIEGRDDLVG